MRVFRGVHDAQLPPVALTIGNFDGLHRGHAAIVAELKTVAAARGLQTALMTFEPHPREFFTPTLAPTRLSSLREKLEHFAGEGLDHVIIQPFNRRFAVQDALAFRDDILARHLNVKHLLVGDDFRFGAQRSGDFALLAASPDFTASHLPTVDWQGERVSSTAVRTALAAGDMELAAQYLGRPYSISGRVMDGDKLGRKIGYPTANVQLKHNRPPLMGVFVVEVHGLGASLQGVASLGIRPTVKNPQAQPVLEVHIFDFDRDIYREHLQIDFLHKLRNEQKFAGLDELVAQIGRDCEAARAWFAART